MSRYSEYLIDIKDREKLGLKPKPIDDALLLSEIISNIKDLNNKERSNHYNSLFTMFSQVLLVQRM